MKEAKVLVLDGTEDESLVGFGNGEDTHLLNHRELRLVRRDSEKGERKSELTVLVDPPPALHP